MGRVQIRPRREGGPRFVVEKVTEIYLNYKGTECGACIKSDFS